MTGALATDEPTDTPESIAADAYPAALSPPVRQAIGPASIGWGVIGASQVAARWMVPAIRQQPPAPDSGGRITGSWAVGLFSHDESRGRAFAADHQIPHVFVNLSDLLRHPAVHCVYIGNHPRHHAYAAMAALAAGKHVLCEPPLALTPEQAQDLQQVAASHGCLLGVNHQRRVEPAMAKLRELMLAGAIGDPLGGHVRNTSLLAPKEQTWRLQPNGGGVVLDRTLHDVDLLRFLFSAEVASVYAESTQRIWSQAVEEEVLCHVRMAPAGPTIQLHDSFIVPHADTRLEVYGSAGTLISTHCLDDAAGGELFLAQRGRLERIPLPEGNPYQRMVYRFQQAVRGDVPLSATAEDGIRSLAVAQAVFRSIQLGRSVDVSRVT